jgi:hypothetical protein
MLKLLLATAALSLGAGAAHAQDAANPAPPNPGLMGENSTVRNGGDTSDRDSAAARDAAIAKQQAASRGESGRKSRTVPALPGDVTVGALVRDSKGVPVGAIESISMSAAVLKADAGAVEVPLEAFGKDGKGLLIGMTKADFDKAVAAATAKN